MLGSKLKDLFKASGYSISYISKNANVDRSTIYKFYNNERTPTPEQYQRLLALLQPSKLEKHYLDLFYGKARLGEDYHDAFIYVQEMYQSLNQILLNKSKIEISFNLHSETTQKDVILYTSNTQVQHALEVALLRHNASNPQAIVRAYIPYCCPAFSNALVNLHSMHSNFKVSVQHLFEVQTPNDGYIERDLQLVTPEMVAQAVYLSSLPLSNYRSACVYVPDMWHQKACQGFDFFILIGEHIYLINSDLDSMLQVSSEDLYSLSKRYFDDAFGKAIKSSIATESSKDLVFAIKNKLVSNRCRIFIRHVPFLEKYFYKLIREGKIHPQLKHDEALPYFKALSSDEVIPLHIIYSNKGIDTFLKTGVISSHLSSLIDPLSEADRQTIFNVFNEECKTENTIFREFDYDVLPIPQDNVHLIFGESGAYYYSDSDNAPLHINVVPTGFFSDMVLKVMNATSD